VSHLQLPAAHGKKHPVASRVGPSTVKDVKKWKDLFWLVLWNMEFYVPNNIGNVIIPTDEVIFFRGIETTNQYLC
jgi:hypothetical protein